MTDITARQIDTIDTYFQFFDKAWTYDKVEETIDAAIGVVENMAKHIDETMKSVVNLTPSRAEAQFISAARTFASRAEARVNAESSRLPTEAVDTLKTNIAALRM